MKVRIPSEIWVAAEHGNEWLVACDLMANIRARKNSGSVMYVAEREGEAAGGGNEQGKVGVEL